MNTGLATCAKRNVTVSEGETDVTARGLPLNIESVRYWTEQTLTKRRAVDFCRVAASLCRMA
ncbi:putative leader peptide [Actinomadura sp. GTD37]|uniref:putative leader peptide n=1 Tax=Actinomadura sp. GTD37 TaxID=1778030 RepID=UPI0035BF398B